MNRKPIIAITIDSGENGYSDYPWYAIRQNYSNVIAKYGGTPILMPHINELIDDYIDMIDGLMLTGGDFDINPKYWNDFIRSNKVVTNDKRTDFEYKLTKAAIKKKIPILGICAGEQLINVIFGGSLIQHIPDMVDNPLEHQQPKPKDKLWHNVKVKENTMLHKITGSTSFDVNSTHHQAIGSLGKDVKATAHAEDGVIEAIEIISYPYCIGVQWHPEYESSKEDQKIIKSFIEACNNYEPKDR